RLPVPRVERGNKKAGGPCVALRLLRRGAISAGQDLRRAHVSRVRGAERRARSQHLGCDAGEADVVHLASAPSWSGAGVGWGERPPRRRAEYPPRQPAVNTTDDVV